MSLQHVAQHLASQGRHGDSMLVHMTPHEVAGIQTLLQHHGRTMTINPHTGLPEAWLGNDIVNAASDFVSGVGDTVRDITSSPLGSLLAGAALMAVGLPPHLAALAVGGASLASGNSFQQSVKSGLSAYGGARAAGSMGVGEAAAGTAEGASAAGTAEGASAAPTLPGGTAAAAAEAPISAPVQTVAAGNADKAALLSDAGYAGTPTTAATVAGNADKAALLGNTGYGAGMTGAETSAFDAGMQAASGAAPTTAASTTPSLWDKVAGYGDKATAAMSAHPYYTAGGAYLLGATTGGDKNKQPTQNPDGSYNYEGAYVRPYVYDPKTGGLRALTPVKAPVKTVADGGVVHAAGGGLFFPDNWGSNTSEHSFFGGLIAYAKEQAAKRAAAEAARDPAQITSANVNSYLQGTGSNPVTTVGQANQAQREGAYTLADRPEMHNTSQNIAAFLEGRGANPITATASAAPTPSPALNIPQAAATTTTTSTDQKGVYFARPDGSIGYYTPPAPKPPAPAPEPTPPAPEPTPPDHPGQAANGGLMRLAQGGYNLGGYSDGGRLLKGPGDGVSDSIPATIGDRQPARLADGEFVIPARIVSELGNGSTDAGARQLYKMMDRIQADRKKTVGKNKVATNTRAAKNLPA